MSTETGKPAARNPRTDLDVSDLPPELQHVAITARWAEDALDTYRAELERRDRAIAAADQAGYSYSKIKGAARRGDGHATESMVRAAIIRYS